MRRTVTRNLTARVVLSTKSTTIRCRNVPSIHQLEMIVTTEPTEGWSASIAALFENRSTLSRRRSAISLRYCRHPAVFSCWEDEIASVVNLAQANVWARVAKMFFPKSDAR